MKKLAAVPLLVVCLLLSGLLSQPARAGVSFDFFYSSLGPSGHWLVSGSYGRVWQPAVYQTGWNPYYDGHWVYTDLGWSWVSDYEWGATCYHYGTWVLDPGFGWVWVPGYVWAPAWVVFRTGPDYIGWTPVPPGYAIGDSVSVGFDDPDLYVFVGTSHFVAPSVRAYVVPRAARQVVIDK